MFAIDDHGQRSLPADFSPALYNGVQQMYTPPSEWTPARRALPPWPTTWPPPPCPWTTGSPGRCSTSSSRGPKGSSATVYPTLAAVHVYSRLVLFIPYHSLLNYIRLPLYLTPSTYLRIVVPVPGQVQTWCYCIQQCRS